MHPYVQRFLAPFGKMRAENWGGIISLLGTLVLGFGGDAQSVGAMISSLMAEAVFARFGHKTAGYSAGCAFIAVCGIFILSSVATEGNAALRFFIMATTAAWFLGALRYPVERIGVAISSAKPALSGRLLKAASVVQPVVGCIALVLRVPVLVSAAIGGNFVVFLAVLLYGAADILLGRIHALRFWRAKNKTA